MKKLVMFLSIFILIILIFSSVVIYRIIVNNNAYDPNDHRHAEIEIKNFWSDNTSLPISFDLDFKSNNNLSDYLVKDENKIEIYDLKYTTYSFSLSSKNNIFRFFGNETFINGTINHKSNFLEVNIDNGNEKNINFNICYSSGKFFEYSGSKTKFNINIPGYHSLNLTGIDGGIVFNIALWYPPP